MSAYSLARAAALMRDRAKGASEGPWTHDGGWTVTAPPPDGWDGPFLVLGADHARNDAEHAASWHPLVALAVADWLDEVHSGLSTYNATTRMSARAFAVANAYLGASEVAP